LNILRDSQDGSRLLDSFFDWKQRSKNEVEVDKFFLFLKLSYKSSQKIFQGFDFTSVFLCNRCDKIEFEFLGAL